MQFVKGFGKNYFTFAAMTIYSSAKKISDLFFQCKTLAHSKNIYESDTEESPPDLEDEQSYFCIVLPKPCYCNKIFAQKAYIAIHLHIFIPRCPYYNKYFAFRRSGSHPPKTLFI